MDDEYTAWDWVPMLIVLVLAIFFAGLGYWYLIRIRREPAPPQATSAEPVVVPLPAAP
jgi:hypothetical protein